LEDDDQHPAPLYQLVGVSLVGIAVSTGVGFGAVSWTLTGQQLEHRSVKTEVRSSSVPKSALEGFPPPNVGVEDNFEFYAGKRYVVIASPDRTDRSTRMADAVRPERSGLRGSGGW
jgi:hypothetical protein